ncbi:hypothetical protein PM082_014910 [Marasmius tenuissimus]|nr:hypothetical protein PM082_014910 [Marasmius tenuissimus]
MVVDFVILSLTAYKTYVEYRDMYHGGLIKLIFRDGLTYFVVVFLSNLFAMILSLLNLNPIMAIAADALSSMIATIGACRLVRRLHRYAVDKPRIPTISHSLPTTRSHTRRALSQANAEAHIEATTFTRGDVREHYSSPCDDDPEGG